MTREPLKVLLVYDLPEPVARHDRVRYLTENTERPTERDVARALVKAGHDVHVHGVYDDVTALWGKLNALSPDVVFNLCETFNGDRSYEGDVASILSLARVPFTGSPGAALHLCKDKGLSKKIAEWEGIKIPAFAVFPREEFKFERFNCEFPLIVKPLNREASEGISQASIVYDWAQCEERARWVATKLQCDVIVEEFVHGRELYVGVFESGEGITALPARELYFANLDKNNPMVATYKAKWDDDYRDRWGISTGAAATMTEAAQSRLLTDSVRLFKSLGLRGYARVDWRMNERNEPVLLEVNPNPALAQDDDFAKAAKSAGKGYVDLIDEILRAAVRLGPKSKIDAYGASPAAITTYRAEGRSPVR